MQTHTQLNITQPKEKNAVMPFAATWMDLEIIILSKVRKRQTLYDITYVESKKIIEMNLFTKQK